MIIDISTKIGTTSNQGGFKGLLDVYSGAAAAYSLRKLSKATTSVVRVRRDSDNAEADFTAQEITDGTLETWVGAGNDGLVTTWYDQSGNGNDATQATAANQPKIVSSGSTILENGKPSLSFDGVSTSLIEGNGATNIQNVSLFSVTKPNNTNDDACVFAYPIIGNSSGISFGQGDLGSSQVWGSRYRNTSTDISTSGIALTTSQSLISSISINLTSTQIYANTIAGGLSSSSRLNYDYTEIGGAGNGNFIWDGNIQEIIIYESDQSTNRSGIEANINKHYNIYP